MNLALIFLIGIGLGIFCTLLFQITMDLIDERRWQRKITDSMYRMSDSSLFLPDTKKLKYGAKKPKLKRKKSLYCK